MNSRPYLQEKIASGDKFNPVALGGLILVLFLTSLWIKSSWNLIGNFSSAVGVFGKDPIKEVQVSTLTDNNNESNEGIKFYNGQDKNSDGKRRTDQNFDPAINNNINYTFTPYPTYTPYPTPTPFNQYGYRLNPVDHQILMDDIDYNLEEVLYKRQYQLKNWVQEFNKEPRIYRAKYSYYWPPLGGINCDKDCNVMASGLDPGQYVGIGWACDMSIAFNTIIYVKELDIFGICVDRGGMIRQDSDGLFWFDHLIKNPLVGFGTPLTILVYDR